jgi:BirA family transcriptional regulator, biotin operon repressor / biotin---[acetyl-CoA-carboxylase] ligase
LISRVAPDLARAEAAIAARGGGLGKPLHVLAETTSTNDEAKRAAKAGAPHGSTWVTEVQTAGRGRQGRVWTSPRGENLLFSVLARMRCPAARLPQLALVAGLAVHASASRVLGSRGPARIKWPNDVVVDDKKLAGVLVESILSGPNVEAVVVGVGLNVHTREFPPEIGDRATSLAVLGAPRLDRGEILADVLAELDRDLTLVAGRGLGLVHARLAEHDALKGKRVRGEPGEGIAGGIDPEGRLLVHADDGTLQRWSAGEVHLA